MGTLAVQAMLDDPDSLCIIRECCDLEAEYSTGYMYKIITNADKVYMREVKREIKKCDRKLQMNICIVKAHQIAEVEKLGGS